MQVWSDPRRRRWILWGTLAAAFLFVNVYRLSTAVIADDLMGAFRITGTQLGMLHAVFFVVYAIMQIPTGVLVDRVGPRWTAACGAVIMNVGAIWFGLAQGFGAGIAARFLVGLGGSVIFISMLRFTANWYRPREFVAMNGVCFAVGGLGGILATTPFAVMVDGLGWRTAMIGLGAGGLVVAMMIGGFVRDTVQQTSLDPISEIEPTQSLRLEEIRPAVEAVLRDRFVWIVSILLFWTAGINLTLFGLWGIPYVVQIHGTSVRFASLFTLAGGIGAVLGPPMIGALAARIGHRDGIILLGTVLYTVAITSLAVFPRPPLLLIGGVFFSTGALLGAFVLTFPLVKDRHPARISGITLGTVNGAGFVGASVLPTVMGRALDAYWTGEVVAGARVYTTTGYRIAFGLLAIGATLTVFCALWLHRTADTRFDDDRAGSKRFT